MIAITSLLLTRSPSVIKPKIRISRWINIKVYEVLEHVKYQFEVKSNFGLKDSGICIAPKFCYAFNNQLTINLGLDYFDGNPTTSYLG